MAEEQADPPAAPKRPTRTLKRSVATREALKRLDAAVIGKAQERAYISPRELSDAQHRQSFLSLGKRPFAVTQVLLLERTITAGQVQQLLEDSGFKLYSCGACHQTYSRDEIEARRGWSCRRCEAPLAANELESDSWLSSVEVLMAHEPEELILRLRPEGANEAASLDHYEVLDELGRGGYGVVWKIRDRRDGEEYALKVYRAHGRPDWEAERFVQEGQSMGSLDHESILKVYEVGRRGDFLFIRMELIDGASLKELVRANIPMDYRLDVFESVTEALHVAHESGLIHRDIKPSNVLVRKDSRRGLLFDFGLAKDTKRENEITEPGQVVGTPFYTSPDQIMLGANKIDRRSDVFSLGVMLYELLTGRRPFEAPTRSEVYTQILHQEPTSPRELNPEVSKPVEVVCEAALHKDRRQRYPTALALLEALRGARAQGGPTALELLPASGLTPLGSVTPAGGSAPALDSPLQRRRRTGRRGATRSAAVRRRKRKTNSSTVFVAVIALLVAFFLGVVLLSPARGQDVKPLPKNDALLPLDLGVGDKKAFPELCGEDWVPRSFFCNSLLELKDDARAIRGLRLALNDVHPLVRGFALRGLSRRSLEALRSHGGKPLFDGLMRGLESKERYVLKTTRSILRRLGGALGPARKAPASDWQDWWRQSGEKSFRRPGKLQPIDGEKKVDDPKLKLGKKMPKAATVARNPYDGARSITEFASAVRERGLETVFVVDVTPSMADELARVRSQIQEITGFFMHLLPKKVRLGMVTYGDEVISRVRLSSKLPRFARAAQKLQVHRNKANRTYCEGLDKGLAAALDVKAMGWLKRDTLKTIVILGDAPPHPRDRALAVALAEAAAKHGLRISAIIAVPPKVTARAEPVVPISAICKAGKGIAVKLDKPEELITRLLVLSFGARFEPDLRRFVIAYREITAGAKR